MSDLSTDYHDYVFKDGELIADFEGMYKNSSDVPWQQDKQEDWMDLRLTVDVLKDFGSFDEIHDIACGLGYYLNIIKNYLGSDDCSGFGYDISGTACKDASKIFPNMVFKTIDLTQNKSIRLSETNIKKSKRLIILRATLWYVYPKISDVVKVIHNLMRSDDTLIIVQNFPPLNSEFIGKDVIPDNIALIEHFSSYFRLIRSVWYQDTIKTKNDNWFIGVFNQKNNGL